MVAASIVVDDGAAGAQMSFAKLEKLDAAVALENEEDPDYEEQVARMEEKRAQVTEVQAQEALERLLSKAEKYTQFLNRKLMNSKEEEKVETKQSDAPTPSKKKRKLNNKRVEAEEEKKDDPTPPEGQPKLLTGGILRDYQIKGFQWMVSLYENGLHGILSDEMGLGKTVQTIALLAHLREMGVYGPYLIVVPLSTLPNWVSEFERWAPSIPVLLYHGTKDERAEMRAKYLKSAKAASRQMDKFPVTVTTYDIVCRDRKDLQRCRWKHLIVDEGHRLKNHKCRLFQELNELCGGSVLRGGANKLLLTGTPLQNNLSELWSLLNFLMPEIFDDLLFFQSVFAFDGVGSKGHDEDLVKKQQEENIVSKLHKILAPFMMRRLKVDVEKNMPDKKEVVLYVPMTSSQKEMYQSIVRGELSSMLESLTGTKTQLNNVLMQLRKCCLHPFLHFEPTDASGHYVNDERLIESSGKVKALDQMLSMLKSKGHKVLVFSQFTSLLDIVQDYLHYLRPNWKVCRIDGSTPLADRRSQMHDFNNDPDHFCFLLSTRAGGVGINLMAADTVIIFDSDWNPHQDNQAQDRAHRIGQKNDVMVYRLITSKSVELKILERANSKRKLERVVCAKNAAPSSKGGGDNVMNVDDLRRLLADDFTGHAADAGECTPKMLEKLMDRRSILDGITPTKGQGYEIVEHKASSIVGGINE